MKTSYLGRLIQAIESCDVSEDRDAAGRMKRAHKFLFDADEVFDKIGDVCKYAEQLAEYGLFRLPFEEVVFEVGIMAPATPKEAAEQIYIYGNNPFYSHSSYVVIAWHDGSDILFRLYDTAGREGRCKATIRWSGESELKTFGRRAGSHNVIIDDHPLVQNRIAEMISDDNKAKDRYLEIHPGEEWVDHTFEDRYRILSFMPCTYLFVCVALLNLKSGIKLTSVPAPKFINQKRARKGKPPIYEHTLVAIDYGSASVPGTRSASATHASPRLHWRRGHIRTYSDGTRTFVRACIVGSPDAGVIEHDYVVRLAGRRKEKGLSQHGVSEAP